MQRSLVGSEMCIRDSHPYGILDGLVMGSILAQCRANFKIVANDIFNAAQHVNCLLYTSPSPRDYAASRMPSSA